MRNVGWLVLSFYVLTAFVLVGMTQFDTSLAGMIRNDGEDQRAALLSYCKEWPSDSECIVSSLPAPKN